VKLLSPAPKQLDLASPEPANISGKRLSEHFSGLRHTLSEFTIEPARKYYIPPELMNGQNFAIEIEDLPRLLTYNHNHPPT
jgi:hypothetical protein